MRGITKIRKFFSIGYSLTTRKLVVREFYMGQRALDLDVAYFEVQKR